jgi:hypothetical protein
MDPLVAVHLTAPLRSRERAVSTPSGTVPDWSVASSRPSHWRSRLQPVGSFQLPPASAQRLKRRSALSSPRVSRISPSASTRGAKGPKGQVARAIAFP